MKDLSQKYIFNVWKIEKIMAYTARESALTNRNLGLVYKYVSIRRKINLSVVVMSENGRKKWFPLARKSLFTSSNKVIFSENVFPPAENNFQIKEYCFK